MSVAIIDFETTSANTDTARPWGWAVCVASDDFKEFKTYEGLMWADDYEDICSHAMRVCGVEEPRLPATTTHTSSALEEIVSLLDTCDLVIAYNAVFDSRIFGMEFARQYSRSEVPRLNWACALSDVAYEDFYRCRQLSHICLDHGIYVPNAHGAKADVEAVRTLMEHRGLTRLLIEEYRDEPWVYMTALLPKPWGKTELVAKELQKAAKEDGYSWQTCRGTAEPVFTKKWVKRVKSSLFEEEKAKKMPFKREVLDVINT